MALIKCYECGHLVSDKALSCPKCGLPSDHFKIIPKCEECGAELLTNSVACDSCGCPIDSDDDNFIIESETININAANNYKLYEKNGDSGFSFFRALVGLIFGAGLSSFMYFVTKSTFVGLISIILCVVTAGFNPWPWTVGIMVVGTLFYLVNIIIGFFGAILRSY